MVDFRLLGSFSVDTGERLLHPGFPRQQAVLAILLASVGRPVPTDRLIHRLWGEQPPASARQTLYPNISWARKLLSDLAVQASLRREASGYLLDIDPDLVDVHRFERLVEAAGAVSSDDDQRASLLTEALRLWRGEPFAGMPGHWFDTLRRPLHDRRLTATLTLTAVELRRGNHARLLGPLTELASQHPLHEPLAAAIMRVLQRDGRDAEALDCFATVQHRLRTELGADPGPELAALHKTLLAGISAPQASPLPGIAPPLVGRRGPTEQFGSSPARDGNTVVEPLVAELMGAGTDEGRPADARSRHASDRTRLSAEPGVGPSGELQAGHFAISGGEHRSAGATVATAQLPRDTHVFVGRERELILLDELRRRPDSGATAIVAVLTGTAGIGKTALAVRWAHQVASRFPDGQLYVNLLGFDPAGQLMEPAEALRGFLYALGVPPERIPPSLPTQAALYRSLLAGKRILVVLDNARDAEHVRPLLPTAPGCLAVVTSRNQLTSLVAADGAYPIVLDVLPAGEAHELLARRLGAGRLAAEPDAVRDIITACGGLPLALNIAGARAQQVTFPLVALADELRLAGTRLDALDAGDARTDTRTVFSWSYTALSPSAARLFRLLGLHTGPDISTSAAASLAGRPVRETRRLLAELTRASLLVEHVPGRVGFHDLLRAYAADLVGTEETHDSRHAALGRLFDHYIHTAHAADRLLRPGHDPIDLPIASPAPGANPVRLNSVHDATTWLTTELPVLVASLRQAADTGFDTQARQLAWVLDTYLDRRAAGPSSPPTGGRAGRPPAACETRPRWRPLTALSPWWGPGSAVVRTPAPTTTTP